MHLFVLREFGNVASEGNSFSFIFSECGANVTTLTSEAILLSRIVGSKDYLECLVIANRRALRVIMNCSALNEFHVEQRWRPLRKGRRWIMPDKNHVISGVVSGGSYSPWACSSGVEKRRKPCY